MLQWPFEDSVDQDETPQNVQSDLKFTLFDKELFIRKKKLWTKAKFGFILSVWKFYVTHWACEVLTVSQTTKFRLFQTERVCLRTFQICRTWQKALQTCRKHCGKRKNCSSRAISPFPKVFFKRLVLQTREDQGLFGKELKHERVDNWSSLLKGFWGKLSVSSGRLLDATHTHTYCNKMRRRFEWTMPLFVSM